MEKISAWVRFLRRTAHSCLHTCMYNTADVVVSIATISCWVGVKGYVHFRYKYGIYICSDPYIFTHDLSSTPKKKSPKLNVINLKLFGARRGSQEVHEHGETRIEKDSQRRLEKHLLFRTIRSSGLSITRAKRRGRPCRSSLLCVPITQLSIHASIHQQAFKPSSIHHLSIKKPFKPSAHCPSHHLHTHTSLPADDAQAAEPDAHST